MLPARRGLLRPDPCGEGPAARPGFGGSHGPGVLHRDPAVPGARRTLEMIGPLLGRFGITRLADITGLDFLGVPVAQAVRPCAATVTVSQGKGATLAAAMVSAAMEAIELHHAENAVPPPALPVPPRTSSWDTS